MDVQAFIDSVKFDQNGLVPAVAQDVNTGAVVMLAYMNEQSLRLTLETGKATYFSRSRHELWEKGSTSGNTQQVLEVYKDCDGDSLLIKIKQTGPACHTGEYSCFHTPAFGTLDTKNAGPAVINEDYAVIVDRAAHPVQGSYTTYLFNKGIDKMCKKVGEEASEVIIAAKNGDKKELTYEAADLVFHMLVVMAKIGVTPDELYAAIKSRQKG